MTYSQDLAQYFDASKLPIPDNEYVAWIDVMGMRANLSKSLPVSANFVFKLHSAVLDTPHTGIQLYPVMDGVFAVGDDKDEVIEFLKNVMTLRGSHAHTP